MNCDVCRQPYNLVNNIPMELPCCDDVICSKCQKDLSDRAIDGKFVCPNADSCNEL